ncbi:hypothetical protein CLV46_2722 [Diaminobutyricimonas aerilata]|uniref:Ig-like domain-containing protein n=1 Tax=Diaminobutyricimonas aerilata TaxID=1162967 RepID=A0A2M9CML8_9MICO|nr:thioester domain-containing protein [Diaminobutyricimonas aerilata]PJJ73138.1 hypothetical protein CLV46_2722 [Diaminobutyricimonas aerilata]
MPLLSRLAALLLLISALVAAPVAASAVVSTGHGHGHLWSRDGASWLGSYRLADGRLGFCLQVDRPVPTGHDYTVGEQLLEALTPDDAARLAWISRAHAGSADADTAAAGQLATWTLTGLGGRSPEWYAARANGSASRVAQLARDLLAAASAPGGASRGASATLTLDLRPDGTGTVRSDLLVDWVATGSTPAAPATATGTVTLTGAVFADGTASAAVPNGSTVEVRAIGSPAVHEVSAEVAYTGLPFGAAVTVARSATGSQDLIVVNETSAHASARSSASVVSSLPFQPRVQTQTSAATAEAGALVHDVLEVTALPGDGLSDGWGVYEAADGTRAPVPVTVRSTLLGPFPAPPVHAAQAPPGAPVACEVATEIGAGPGRYTTPACALPATGYFVWVERISPDDTPPDRGRDRVRPWVSEFAVASEITFVPFPPRIATVATAARVEPGGCVADHLDVTGLNPAAGALEVTSILLGPFTEPPTVGAELAAAAPEAGRVSTSVTADGRHTTTCIPVPHPGHYVFVYESPGVTDAAGTTIVPPFADRRVHASETVLVAEAAPTLAVTGPLATGAVLALAASLLATGTGVVSLGRARRAARAG